jgi:transposase
VADSEGIADLLRHGLLRASFIPPRPQRDRRELTRSRTSRRYERVAEVNRLQKTLDGANIKLASVVSDITGKSGHQMLRALVAGTTEAARMAQLARGVLRQKIPQLQRALAGQFSAHHRFLVAQQLAHLDALDLLMEQVGEEIATRLDPHAEELRLLQTLPGVGQRTAEVILAEIGSDMSRFPSAGHLASWIGLCPGNQESAGKRQSGPEWAYPQRQPVVARGLGRGSAGGRTDETSHLQRGAVASSGRTTGSQTRGGGGGGGACAGDHDLPHVAAA